MVMSSDGAIFVACFVVVVVGGGGGVVAMQV